MSQNWEEFLKLKNKTNLKGMDTVPITLRIPKDLKKIMIEDLRALEDEEDKIPMNSYILLMIMHGTGAVQKGEDEFYRSKNLSLEKHLKENGYSAKKKKKK